jgi:hypothetical protein
MRSSYEATVGTLAEELTRGTGTSQPMPPTWRASECLAILSLPGNHHGYAERR